MDVQRKSALVKARVAVLNWKEREKGRREASEAADRLRETGGKRNGRGRRLKEKKIHRGLMCSLPLFSCSC